MKRAIILGNCPSKSNCYKIISIRAGAKVHASLAKTKALKAYEDNFYIQLPSEYRNALISSYFEFYIDVYYPSQRSDLDNSLKVVLDCLQKSKAIKNDNKCVKIVAQKFKDSKEPRVEFHIKPV